MKKHELKILPKYFQAVWDGIKTFELRKDDRDYQRGDILVLKEWDGEKYTGSALCVKVTYILQDAEKYGLKDGYIIMGIRRITDIGDFKPQTNADKIRSFSDEELAKFVENYMGAAPWCRDEYPVDPVTKACLAPVNECWECALLWLKSPVEESNGIS